MIYTQTPSTGALFGDVFWFGQYGINKINVAIIVTDDNLKIGQIDCDVIETSGPQNALKEKNCKHFAAEGNVTLIDSSGCATTEYIKSLRTPVTDYKAGNITVDKWTGKTSSGGSVSIYPFAIVKRGINSDTTYRTFMPNNRAVETLLRVRWKGRDEFCVSFDTHLPDGMPLWEARGYSSIESSYGSLGTRNATAIRSHHWRSFTFTLPDETRSTWECRRRECADDYIHWDIGTSKERYTGNEESTPCITEPFSGTAVYWGNQKRRVRFNTNSVDTGSLFIPQKLYSWHLFSSLQSVYEKYETADDGNSVWSHLMTDALDSMRILDQNLAMTLLEWSRLKSDLTEYLNSVAKLPAALRSQSIGNLKKAKDVASVYLGGKYGYNLTFQEAMDMGERLASFTSDPTAALGKTRAKQRKCFFDVSSENGLGTYIDLALNYGITVSSLPNVFSEAYNKLRKFSAWVTLEDAWDFIPYSFVIDWLVDFSQVFKAIDTMGETANLQLLSCIKSYKMEGDLNLRLAYPWLSKYLLQGDAIVVPFKQYSRWCESEFDSPPLIPSIGSFPEIFSRHWPEATALIIQRL